MEEEMKGKKISVSVILLIIALIVIVVMGIFMFKLNKDKKELEEGLIYANEAISKINEEYYKGAILDTISLRLKDGTLSNNGATFILKNNTDEDYSYEPAFYIEKREDDEWKEITLKEPLSWNSVLYILKSGEETEINIDWSNTAYGTLNNGLYRLVKKNFRKISNPDSSTFSVEEVFNIEDNK